MSSSPQLSKWGTLQYFTFNSSFCYSLTIFLPDLVLFQSSGSNICSTTISEDLRRDCHPEPGATEVACLSRGCRWCETSSLNVPFCFYDSTEDAACPSDVPVQKRVDCHPQPDASKEKCEAKGCIWCSTKVPNAPWCYFPADDPYGYFATEKPQKTSKGWR